VLQEVLERERKRAVAGVRERALAATVKCFFSLRECRRM